MVAFNFSAMPIAQAAPFPLPQSAVTNADFLAAIFHTRPEGASPVVVGFDGDPNEARGKSWWTYPANGNLAAILRPGTNQYFSIASVRPDAKGRYTRTNPAAVHCVVIDDIGTNGKVDPDTIPLEPSWELETSPDNCQWGYILDQPLTDLGLFSRVLDALKAQGFTDPNGNNAARLVRLPEGCNAKASVIDLHGEPFPGTLHIWEPDRHFTIGELIDGLGLDLAPAKPPAPAPAPAAPIAVNNDGPWAIQAKRIALDAALRTITDSKLGRHTEIFAIGCRAARDGLPPEALEVALQTFVENMRATNTSGQATGVNWEVERKTIKDGYFQGHKDGKPPAVDMGALVQMKRPAPATAAPAGNDEGELSLEDAERLVAWCWETKNPLPDPSACPGVFKTAPDAKGKTRARLRVPIYGNFTAPWVELAFKAQAREAFLAEVDAYLPRREEMVLRDAEKAGKEPNDLDSETLRQHAEQWQGRIDGLLVDEEAGRALYERFTPKWPDPQPIPSALLPVAPFDYALLPDALRPWVSDIAERMQCPPDYVAVGAMVAASSVIGRKCVIRPKRHDDWSVVPNLWGDIVGRPGIMKSPALSAAMEPVKRLEEAASAEYKKNKAEFKREEKFRGMAQKETESKAARLIKNGKPEEAKQLLAKADAEAEMDEDRPTLRRYKVTDTSVEALGEILIENPWGILAYRDELHGLLRSMDKEGQEGARAFYLQGYDANQSYTFDRIMRGKNLHIDAVCIAMLGGIQPGKLRSYIRHATNEGAGDDGLLQRFGMLVWPDPPKEWVNIDRPPDAEARQRAFDVFHMLDEILPVNDDDLAPAPRVFRFDDQAQQIFDQWRAELEALLRSDELHPALESHFAKYRKLVPAVALICAIVDGSAIVRAQDLLRALAWAEYLRSHAERAYAAGQGIDLQPAEALLAKIRAGKVADGFKPSDIYLKGWAGLSDPKVVGGACRQLCDLGHLARQEAPPGPGGGRPTVTFLINPKAITERN